MEKHIFLACPMSCRNLLGSRSSYGECQERDEAPGDVQSWSVRENPFSSQGTPSRFHAFLTRCEPSKRALQWAQPPKLALLSFVSGETDSKPEEAASRPLASDGPRGISPPFLPDTVGR